MQIRLYESSDIGEIGELFYHTVHTVNAADYTEEQLNAWADGGIDKETWDRTLREHDSAVAVADGRIVGFGDMDADGYFDRLYVHKDWQGRGIGASICERLEGNCPSARLFTYASITARPFFEKRGYRIMKKQQVEKKGQKLTNYLMEKEERDMELQVLETEHLVLRPLSPEDAGEIFSNWTGDSEVAKFMRWNVHQSPEETREWLESEVQPLKEGKVYDWGFILKSTGELIGSGGLCFSDEQGLYELGYNIMKKYWGRGYATEAAKRIVEYALDVLGQKSLYCCHAKDNPASGRVMEKAGFTYWRDGSYDSWDGEKRFICKEYLLETDASHEGGRTL